MLDKQLALLDRMNYLPRQIPDLEKQCCESFLRYSERMLCQLYEAKEKSAVRCGIQVLRSERKRLKPYMNRYERLYIPMLSWCKGWILGNDFSPVQNLAGKFVK
jgi:hypothetical protein